MKDTINKDQFISWFRSSDTYKNNFSYEGLSALFDYLEEMEESTGEELGFDPVALCCEYAEYDSWEQLEEDYNNINYFGELEEKTTVIEIGSNHFIIQQF